jgi:hypothetical protein
MMTVSPRHRADPSAASAAASSLSWLYWSAVNALLLWRVTGLGCEPPLLDVGCWVSPAEGSEPVEGIRLWRANRQRLVGMVYLDKGVLDLDIQDDHERALVEEVFEQTGQVTWSFSRFDEGEWQENIAEPRTEPWLWFVVANILYPMGYQADLGAGRDGEPTHSP